MVSMTSGATNTETERKDHRLQKTSRIPHIPRTQDVPRRCCPNTQIPILQDFQEKEVSIRPGAFWRFLSQPLEGDKGRIERTGSEANKHPARAHWT